MNRRSDSDHRSALTLPSVANHSPGAVSANAFSAIKGLVGSGALKTQKQSPTMYTALRNFTLARRHRADEVFCFPDKEHCGAGAAARPKHQRRARSASVMLSLRMRQSASGRPCALSHSGKAARSLETLACSPLRQSRQTRVRRRGGTTVDCLSAGPAAGLSATAHNLAARWSGARPPPSLGEGFRCDPLLVTGFDRRHAVRVGHGHVVRGQVKGGRRLLPSSDIRVDDLDD